MADVIKEFLISLGFKVEAGQEKKFESSVRSATLQAKLLGDAIGNAAAKVNESVVKIGRSFDGLYWQAQRTQTTVSQIKAISYAVSQLGGSADEAGSSIETFGKNLKWNPGFEGFLKQIGVVTRENGKLRDSVSLMRDFANVLKGRSRAEQMGLAQFAGIDLKTLEALQSGDVAKRMAEHSATLKRLGVNEDEAAAKANALQTALGKLNDTLAGIGTLLLDRFGPSLTQFFEKLNSFILENSEKIVQFFERLGKVAGELYTIFDKLLEVVGPLWQKFDNLTQSIAGTDGLTAALVGLIGLKVAAWLIGVAAAIAKVGTAASVALLGGALGKFLALFGGAAFFANYGTPLESQLEFQKRADAIERPGGRNPFEAIDAAEEKRQPQKDTRNLWQRYAPKILGGKDAPAAAPGVQPTGSGGKANSHFTKENAAALTAAAKDLGVSPEDLATVISYETGGKFDPAIRGGAGNRHIGLIQFGANEQRQYGASTDQSFPDQMKSVVRYLKDRGFKPGMGLLDLYSTINAGRPGLYNRSDAGNGGAPGTVADKVRTMGPHAARARLFLGAGSEPAADRADTPKTQQGGSERSDTQPSTKREDVSSSEAKSPAPQKLAAPDPKDAAAYKEQTGRDLSDDLKSDDRHVRRWASGVRDNLRVKRGEERLGTGEESDAKAQAAVDKANEGPKVSKEDAEAYRRSMGRDINADLHSDNPQAREWAQTVLGYLGDKRKDDLARADDNASKTADSASGGSAPALAPPPATTAGTSVTVNQENHVSVTGSGDPHDTAQQIGQSQREVNGGLVRDLKGAVR